MFIIHCIKYSFVYSLHNTSRMVVSTHTLADRNTGQCPLQSTHSLDNGMPYEQAKK